MAVSNQRLVKEAAAFKADASKEFDKAVKALLDLVWSYGNPTEDFLFEADPELDAKANAILRGLSDNLVAMAKARAAAIVRESLGGYGFDESWEEAADEDDATIIFRFDMEGSHLKELLEVWIALAAVNAIRKSELRVMISRYLKNPYASPLWKGIPLDAIKWGRGYSRDIIDQLALIGQNAIVDTARHAEWMRELENGAAYYIRRRGSNYDCAVCEEMANKPIPISIPFQIPHSRCMCYPEYFYGENL